MTSKMMSRDAIRGVRGRRGTPVYVSFSRSGARCPCPQRDLRPALPQRPVSANRGSGLQQHGKILFDQYLNAGFRRVNGDVERCNYLLGAIAYGCGYRANAARQVFIGERPSSRSHLVQSAVALLRIRLPERCNAGAARLCEHSFQFILRPLCKEHFSKRGLKGRKARADSYRQGDDLWPSYARNVHVILAVEACERGKI